MKKWYEKNNMALLRHTIKKQYQIDLDCSEPIFAKKNNHIYILLPQIKKDNYKIVGYNWFNINTGKYNSCVSFANIEKAIQAYSNYDIYNGKLTVNKNN